VCVAFCTALLLWGPLRAQEAHPAAPTLQDLERDGPLWAYAYSKPPKPGDTYVPQVPELAPPFVRPNENEAVLKKLWTVTGSDKKFSRLDFRQETYPDWFPGDHPAMPRINTFGSPSLGNTRRPCAQCHLANGKGRPENAPPGGQPAAYTLQQLEDFANGLRYTSDPRKSNTHTMIRLAKAMTREEKQAIAEYYEATKWTPWIRVIETEKIPEVHLEEGNMYITVGVERTEPLGARIVETPENELESNYLRSPRSGWNAYVPVGSVAKGRELVTTGGGGKTLSCTVCHGPDLMGVAAIPGIAGRSPSYMMRQMWDMRQGSRKGPMAALMKPVLEKLTVEDMTNITAYLASVMPLPGPVAPPTRPPAP
jgi:cytochrome c553